MWRGCGGVDGLGLGCESGPCLGMMECVLIRYSLRSDVNMVEGRVGSGLV